VSISVEGPNWQPFRTKASERGTKQGDVRAHNERLLLSLIRRHGSLTKAEISRITGLSAQAISVIMRGLEEDGLIHRGDVVRGKIGQPSTPMTLAGDGAFSIGVKIGRRSAEIVLINFIGEVQRSIREAYAWPMPDQILDFTGRGVSFILSEMHSSLIDRIAGLGIASPFELWQWERGVGAPKGAMSAWRSADLVQSLEATFSFPVYLQNDATAACGAEFIFGRGPEHTNYLYIFMGFFIGGGIVINGGVFTGPSGNAGAIGSFPVIDSEGRSAQLIDVASAANLETMIKAAGLDPSPMWKQPDGWSEFNVFIDEWIANISPHLAKAIIGSCSVIDFSAVIIDGGFPPNVRTKLVEATQKQLSLQDLQGINAPLVIEGTVGSQARAIGGACLPFFDKFMLSSMPILSDIV
jgi:predicted NBD/HSP70 family sugar kinase